MSINRSIKFAVIIFGVLFLISIPIVWISLYHTTFLGDLTRIGKISDKLFSAQEPDSKIDASLLISSKLEDAEILVIGDSFSDSLAWQSVLTQNKIKISTILWSTAIDSCIKYPKALDKFAGKIIIFETIERAAVGNIEKLAKCTVTKNSLPLIATPYSRPSKIQTHPQESLNLEGQFFVGAQTILNSYLMNKVPNYYKIYNSLSGSTFISQINDGCNKFSNFLCKYGLFLKDDLKAKKIDETFYVNIRNISLHLKEYKVIWIIVPNKSSIYDKPNNKNYGEVIKKDGLGPNLESFILNKSSFEKDIYSPNDTHFSNKGFLLMGEEIKKYLNLQIK